MGQGIFHKNKKVAGEGGKNRPPEEKNCLHYFVSWAAGAFGDCPADIIERAFALAGLAVQAVRRICGLDHTVNTLHKRPPDRM